VKPVFRQIDLGLCEIDTAIFNTFGSTIFKKVFDPLDEIDEVVNIIDIIKEELNGPID